MIKHNFIEHLYNISSKLEKGIYEEIIIDKVYKIDVDTEHYNGKVTKIYCNNKKVYEIYHNLNKIKIYFDNYTLTQIIEQYEFYNKEITFNNKDKVYITETKIGNNGMWADFNKETNELRHLISKKIELRLNFNNNKSYLCFIDNNKTITKKVEYNYKLIEKFNILLKSNEKLLKNELNDINLNYFYDENIKYITNEEILNKFIETANLFRDYNKKLDETHDEEINLAITSLINKLNKDIKYARINALKYYIKSNDLRDPLILKEVYKEVKSIYNCKDNKHKLIKTRKPLKEYNDIEN